MTVIFLNKFLIITGSREVSIYFQKLTEALLKVF